MRIDTSEPSLTALFEKGQVGLIRTEFMRKDDVIDSIVSENARLKAEVDALKLGSLLTAVDVLQFINLKAEVERLTEALKDEQAVAGHRADIIERLRKAGDAMERSLSFEYPDSPKVKDWNAAKEEKSV